MCRPTSKTNFTFPERLANINIEMWKCRRYANYIIYSVFHLDFDIFGRLRVWMYSLPHEQEWGGHICNCILGEVPPWNNICIGPWLIEHHRHIFLRRKLDLNCLQSTRNRDNYVESACHVCWMQESARFREFAKTKQGRWGLKLAHNFNPLSPR